MEQSLIFSFLKEIAVGLKSAKAYPLGHPVMEKVVGKTMAELAKIYNEIPEFSMYFLGKTVIFQDVRFDVGKNPAIISLLDALKKNDIQSLSFNSGVSNRDIINLYEVISSPKLKIKQYGDAATMLTSRGTEKIKINAVKFGVQTGKTVQVATEKKGRRPQSEIIDEIRTLKELVEKGVSLLEMKKKFEDITVDIEGTPKDTWQPYSEAITRILGQLSSEDNIELMRDVELKPFILKLFSQINDETLIKLIVARAETKNEDVGTIISGINEEKFTKILPALKTKIPDIYEYLARVGILLSEKISSSISKEDLRISIKPYYNMLGSQNASIRKEGMRSLITLTNRFIEQKNYEQADEIISRVSLSISQELVDEVVMNVIDDLGGLYQKCKLNHQDKFCALILEPFTRILGRGGLSISFKKRAIKFLGETGNPAVLPTLFSFLWDVGIYPDVRSAIIKFGRDAVAETLSTLKDVEDYNIRMKLVDILKSIGKESVEILLNNLNAPEWYLRRNILTILRDIGDTSVVNRLEDLLKDKDHRVRLELARAFAKFEYTEGLLKSLNDESVEVKAEALRGLRKKISSEQLIELLPSLKNTGDEVYIEVLKIIDAKRIFEARKWIAGLLQFMESRNDTVAQDIKELGITTLAKLKVGDVKTILEKFKLSKDKRLANLADAALKRIK